MVKRRFLLGMPSRFVDPIAVFAFAKTPRDAFALTRCGIGGKFKKSR